MNTEPAARKKSSTLALCSVPNSCSKELEQPANDKRSSNLTTCKPNLNTYETNSQTVWWQLKIETSQQKRDMQCEVTFAAEVKLRSKGCLGNVTCLVVWGAQHNGRHWQLSPNIDSNGHPKLKKMHKQLSNHKWNKTNTMLALHDWRHFYSWLCVHMCECVSVCVCICVCMCVWVHVHLHLLQKGQNGSM